MIQFFAKNITAPVWSSSSSSAIACVLKKIVNTIQSRLKQTRREKTFLVGARKLSSFNKTNRERPEAFNCSFSNVTYWSSPSFSSCFYFRISIDKTVHYEGSCCCVVLEATVDLRIGKDKPSDCSEYNSSRSSIRGTWSWGRLCDHKWRGDLESIFILHDTIILLPLYFKKSWSMKSYEDQW